MVGEAVSGREEVLSRLRAAVAGGSAPVPVPRAYRREGPIDLDLLVQRLTDYRARVHRVPEADVADTIAGILPTSATVVVPPQLPPAWLPATVTARTDDGLDNARIAAADGVVTAAAVAVVETGTVVLDGSPDQGRRVLSLLPDLHICVVRAAQVVAGVPQALARLAPHRPLTWISGPSATSDIELNRVEGVHGPRTLHVILLP
ncbi:LutC/YkgG family protein [Micromonospora endophytica]|uniref:Lactate utilization protein C n=1 Tax=Micromonospora endophytica TaxID=515350 RepID=A0A2W2CN37_9ACTN|nr:LUD domain-containing protein [Micromonospora endophytica]PZF89789.1 lactate utilization protein C [Micromonospora endophytica]RIW40254.1 lactate utilization protein C [Micromonospora endophytica]BCJ61972.1 lactate utilization protein C [Micromonospora endophytica]